MKAGAPKFFPTPLTFRRWLEAHHETADELWVGFHKKHTGTPSISWPESVDEALCFGWIDGIRKTLDESRYVIRFTPRKARSTWSAVNIARIAELTRLERMAPAGIAAFEKRCDRQVGHLCVRAAADAEVRRRGGTRVSGERQGVGVFPGAAGRISAPRHLLGAERQARRDAGAATGNADRGFSGGPSPRARHTKAATRLMPGLSAVRQGADSHPVVDFFHKNERSLQCEIAPTKIPDTFAIVVTEATAPSGRTLLQGSTETQRRWDQLELDLKAAGWRGPLVPDY